MNNPEQEADRAAFEKYARLNGYNIDKLPDGTFLHDAESILFEGWQAAKANSRARIQALIKENAGLKSVMDWEDYRNCVALKSDIEELWKLREERKDMQDAFEQVCVALETAERLADNKGSDLQYSIIAKAITLAAPFRKTGV